MISPKLPAPRQTALFLDVDGTLLELAPRSEAAGTLGVQLIERMRLPTRLLHGKQGLELLPQGHDKGPAIEQCMFESAASEMARQPWPGTASRM